MIIHCRNKLIGSSVSTQSFVGGRGAGPREDHTYFHSASLPQLLPMYFVDHSGPVLHLYGGGALEMLDATPTHGKQRIEELHFHFIEFNEIAPCLTRLATSYPYVNVCVCIFVSETAFSFNQYPQQSDTHTNSCWC